MADPDADCSREREPCLYEGEMTIAVRAREKAAAISRIDAVLPVGYN
jgi:hypothetical protein